MARYLSDIRSSVRDILLDEFTEGVDLEFETDLLDRLIAITLNDMEQKMPYEVKVTAEDALSKVATLALTTTATSLEVTAGEGADFPTSYPFYITIEDEVLSVTAYPSTDTFTVTRGQKSSTAATHAIGKEVGLTIVTTADSKEIDLTNIKDLIKVAKCEYRISRPSKNPKQFRNFRRFADILTMEMNIVPSADEEVHLYCYKKHTLTDNTSTLKPEHEPVLLLGVCARAARNKGREQINALNVGGVNVGPRMIEVGERWKGDYERALRGHTTKDSYEALPKD